MAGYVSNRFDNNPKAKDLALRINRLGSWLSKSPWKKVSGKWVESINNGLGLKKIINQKLEPLKTNIPQSDIDRYAKGLKLLYATGKYDRQEIIDTYESLKTKKLVYVDGEWHFVNKLNTNWSDITDLIVELVIRMGDLDKVYGAGFTDKLTTALINLKDEKILSAFPRAAFIKAKNSDFDPILKTAREIGLID